MLVEPVVENSFLAAGLDLYRRGRKVAAEQEFERALGADPETSYLLVGLCSTARLSPKLTKKIMAIARRTDPGIHEDGSMESGVPYLEHIVRKSDFIYSGPAKFLAKEIIEMGLKSGKIIDVGTGPGPFAIALRLRLAESFQIIGYDVSDAMLKIAEGRITGLGLNIGLKRGPIIEPAKELTGDNALPFTDESIDIIISHGSMHHWGGGVSSPESVEVMLQELIRILKPGGRIFLFDINPAGIGTKFIVKSKLLKLLRRDYQHEAFKHSAEHSLSAEQIGNLLRNIKIGHNLYKIYPAVPLFPAGFIFHVLDIKKQGAR
ncbi:MAG: class I SAM-dependent methyltransferase [Candidatus Saganbacteria bacterium]|nr:class I SAM-dependent methyltransferase [Candidatus Saganbacteria bacterium]